MKAAMRKPSQLLLFALALTGMLLFFKLGDRPFRDPDEGRYAEIAREMAVTGDWIVPRLYGVDYMRKPALFYWLVAASFNAFGQNEWAARAVPAAFGLFGVFACFVFTRRLFDERTAFIAALILATNLVYLEISRYLVIDAVFSFFVSAGLMAFYLRRYTLFYVFAALGFLAKGPAAFALMGLTAAATLMGEGRLGAGIREMRLVRGALITAAIVVPWFWLAEQREPGFLSHFFLHENFSRYTSVNYEHQEPWWYYLAIFPLMCLPWLLFVEPLRDALDLRRDPDSAPARRFCLTAIIAVIGFYSLSRSKLLTYLMPALPFAAVLIGAGWSRWELDKAPKWSTRLSVALMALLMAASAAVLIGAPVFFQKAAAEYDPRLISFIRVIAMVGIAGSAAGLRAFRRRSADHLWRVWITFLAVLSLALYYVMAAVNPSYSTKQYAEALKPQLKAGDAVYIFDHPGVFYDFRFYLEHPVMLAGLEGELELSRERTPVGERWVPKEEFMAMLRDGRSLYALMRRSDYSAMEPAVRERLRVIMMENRKVLFRSGEHA